MLNTGSWQLVAVTCIYHCIYHFASVETMTPFDQLKHRFPQLIPISELRTNVSIIQLALHYGYQLQPTKGRGRPVLTHSHFQDTIIIKHPHHPGQQLYQRAGDFTDAGTIIDFIRHRFTSVFTRFNHPANHQLTNITQVLYDYLQIEPSFAGQPHQMTPSSGASSSEPTFCLTEFDLRPLEPVNYLLERSIKTTTWQGPEFVGRVFTQATYYDQQAARSVSFAIAQAHPQRTYRTFYNVAFPYGNGQPDRVTGLEIRNRGLKSHALGSERSASVFISNPPLKTTRFQVMESAIDALSHCQLRSQQADYSFDTVYFSTGGQLTPSQVNTILSYIDQYEKVPHWQLHLSFDNDLSGNRYDLQFIQQLVAAQFPLTLIPTDGEYITYQWPRQAQHYPLQVLLLDHIEYFNQQAASQSNSLTTPTQLITIEQTPLHTQITLHTDCRSMAFIGRQLLAVTGLSQRVLISKSSGKDFNQDLLNTVIASEP